MGLFSRRPTMHDLHELWRAEVPGHVAHRYVTDAATGSVYVSDGWGVAHASLAVHRLDLRTGERLASTRTRHQAVGAMTVGDGVLWAVTSKRLLGLDPLDLTTRASWHDGILQDAHAAVVVGRHAVLANWLKPTIAVVDLDDGAVRRVRAGGQPTLVSTPSGPVALSALEGGVRPVDLAVQRLGTRTDAPAVTAAACLDGVVWGATGGRVGSPSGVRMSKPGRRLTRLVAPSVTVDVGGPVRGVVADELRGVLWVLVEGDEPRVVRVDGTAGVVTDAFRASGGLMIEHVDPEAGLVVAREPATGPREPSRDYVVALRLPV